MAESFYQPPETIINGRYVRLPEYGKGGLLGIGGFGSVWAYQDTSMKDFTPVAIKTLSDVPFIIQDEWTIFEKKFKAFRKCSMESPYIATLYDLWREEYHTYLVMELIEGKNLSQWLEAQPQPEGLDKNAVMALETSCRADWKAFKPLFSQIVDGLDYIHKQNIVHRDIKPANIMLDGSNTIKILDFGIAKKLHSSISYSQTSGNSKNDVTGSYPYMSPEQFGVIPSSKIDGRADQYSLAILVYQILTGSLPFEIESDNPILWKDVHCNNEVPYAENLGEEANEVLRKALSKNRDDRYTTCREFFQALDLANVKNLDKYVTIRKPIIGKSSSGKKAVKKVVEKPSSEEKKGHGVRNLLLLIGIVIAIVIGLISILEPGHDLQDVKARWGELRPTLVSIGLEGTGILDNIEGYLNENNASKAGKLLMELENFLKLFNDLQEKMVQDTNNPLYRKNFEKECQAIDALCKNAIASIGDGKFSDARGYLQNAQSVWENIGKEYSILEENARESVNKLDQRISELERYGIKEVLTDKWDEFRRKRDGSKVGDLNILMLSKDFKKAVELCDEYMSELEEIVHGLENERKEKQKAAETSRGRAEEARRNAESNLAYIEIREKMEMLDKTYDEAQALYESGSYEESRDSWERLVIEFDKTAQDAIDNRKKLEDNINRLNQTVNHCLEVAKETGENFKVKIDDLSAEVKQIEEKTPTSSSKELDVQIDECINKWGKLQDEILEWKRNKLELKDQMALAYKDWKTSIKELELYQNYWDDEARRLIKEELEKDKEFKALSIEQAFNEALKLCKEQNNKYKKAIEKATNTVRKKAFELVNKANAIKYQLEKTGNQDNVFADVMNDYHNGEIAINHNNYLLACEKFEKFCHDAIERLGGYFSELCKKYNDEKDWENLKTTSHQWKDFDATSQDAENYTKKAQKQLEIDQENNEKKKFMADFEKVNKNGTLIAIADLLENWEGKYPDDLELKKAKKYYDTLQELNNSMNAMDWKISFEKSIDLMKNEPGKNSGFIQSSQEKIINSLLELEEARKMTEDQDIVTAWKKVQNEANYILNYLPQNESAKHASMEANIALNDLYTKIQAECKNSLQNEIVYNILDESLKRNVSFWEKNFSDNDKETLQMILEVEKKCDTLHELDSQRKNQDIPDDILQKAIGLSNEIIDFCIEQLKLEGCAFAVDCRKNAEDIWKKRQKAQPVVKEKPSVRILNLPNNQKITLLPVKTDNGEIICWMGQCEVSQAQYVALLKEAHEKIKNNKTIYDNEKAIWFGENQANIVKFIERMGLPKIKKSGDSLPVHSIDWHYAFTWCEVLNNRLQNDDRFNAESRLLSEQGYVLRLPTVEEWRVACGENSYLEETEVKKPQPVGSLAQNTSGFCGLLNNVSEWSVESMDSDKNPIYVQPCGFSDHESKSPFQKRRIYMGGSWKTKDDPHKIFMANGGGVVISVERVHDTVSVSSKYFNGERNETIGFRVVWGKPLTP